MDISTITSISLDLAGRNSSYRSQEEISEVSLFLLEKGYRILLFSSSEDVTLKQETFEHPHLKFVKTVVSPPNPPLDDYPELASQQNLWVTDNAGLHAWLVKQNLRFAYTTGTGTFGELGVKLGSVADLTGLFNTTARVRQKIAQAIHLRRQAKGKVPFLIGVGGPPLSGFQNLGVDLKRELEDIGYPLVDLLDLSALLVDTENPAMEGSEGEAWISSAARAWMLDSVLGPLQSGKRVYVDHLPEHVPEAFDAHLPLFLGEEALVVVLGQTLFQPEIRSLLDFTILLEVSARETTRRIYEIPPVQEFANHFTDQYLEREGRLYKAYLDTHNVKNSVLARVNAERPESLTLSFLAAVT